MTTLEQRAAHALRNCENWAETLRHNAKVYANSPLPGSQEQAMALNARASDLEEIAKILRGDEYWGPITKSLVERGII